MLTKDKYGGAYTTPDKKARISWNLCRKERVDNKFVFSATGEIAGGCVGQCLDTILEEHPDDDMVKRIHAVWKEYHLNDCIPGTEGHERLGCGHGKTMAVIYEDLNPVQQKAVLNRAKAANEAAHLYKFIKNHKGGDTAFYKAMDKAGVPHWLLSIFRRQYLEVKKSLPEVVARHKSGTLAQYKAIADRYLKEFEETHPPDLSPYFCHDSLGYPCPDTGKFYGGLFFREIPESVLEEIASWESGEETCSLGESIIMDWMKENGVSLKVWESGRSPSWATECSGIYTGWSVELFVKDEEDQERCYGVFDYFTGSKAVYKDVDFLYCVAQDLQYCDLEFAEFCHDLDYSHDSITARDTWQVIRDNAEKLLKALPREKWDEIAGML